MNKHKQFIELHKQKQPLLLGNVWDVQSALLFQKLGFSAIGTSSSAVATSRGYEDGEKIPFEDLVQIVKSIQTKIKIPLTVDIEGGYSRDVSEIKNNIKTLHQLGVVGINLEDSVTKTKRIILDPKKFSNTIQEIKSYLLKNNYNIFINVRTDPYLLGLENPLTETLRRIKLYEKAGADGIFAPCIVNEDEIKKLVESTKLPINVMCMPELPPFTKLESLGVKRISMGSLHYNIDLSNLEIQIKKIIADQSFNCLFVKS
ncbi:MAG: isocitrate lyase/phosphoenolpyruvate mutase family protein [Melioribacteraceae bacterium]